MINENFLNLCFQAIFSKVDNPEVKINKDFYRDINELLNNAKTEMKNDIPIDIVNKIDCLEVVCRLKFDNKDNDAIIDSLSVSEKYKNLMDFISLKSSQTIDEQTFYGLVEQVRNRKKLNCILANHENISQFVDKFKKGNFDCLDDIVNDYESLVRQSYLNVVDSNKGAYIEACQSLNLEEDNYDSVVKMIIKKFERKNITPSGFYVLDNEVLNGGFEPSRLYTFIGGSGSGKSTLMCNFITNAATNDSHRYIMEKVDPRSPTKNVYLYITLENTVDESLLRMYQSLFDKTVAQAISDLVNGVDIKQKINNLMSATNSVIIMKYYRPRSISCIDLCVFIQEVLDKYGVGSLKGLYLDYLDKLRSDTVNKNLEYRLELGFIVDSLKAIAIQFGIPIITLSQLNRSAYGVKDSRELGNEMVGDSIKKVENSDCICLLQKDKMDDTIVHANFSKARNGKSNVFIDFKVNFQYYKFLKGFIVTSKNKINSSGDNLFGFEGVDHM